MGTMDVINLDDSEIITLDDTTGKDSILYVIDETPNLANNETPNLANNETLEPSVDETSEPVIDESPKPVMEELTNKGNESRRSIKRKNKWAKKNSAKKDKMNSSFNNTIKANLTLIRSLSDNNLPNQTLPTNSTSNSINQNNNTKFSRNNKKLQKRLNKPETIVVLSDEDSADESDSVIVLSDDEMDKGIIGGKLSSASVARDRYQGQKHFRNRNINQDSRCKIEKPGTSNPSTSKASSPNKSSVPARKLRPIVIDGSNVAFGHGGQQHFSSRGLEICCNYFLSRGHTVKVFVPQFRRRHYATMDTHILDKLEKDKVLVFTPSRRVNGKQIVSYDDRYIVEYATTCGGIIVSRDHFHDVSSENPEWKETIDKRLLMYTWVDDVLMFPNDPLGRQGPTLEEFLSFSPEKPKEKPKSGEIIITK